MVVNARTLFTRSAFKIAVLAPMLALGGLAASGAQPAPCTDAPVTTIISDVDPVGNAYTVASDGKGSYFNGVDNVMSILTCNGYNGIEKGDWQFNKLSTSLRKMAVSLNMDDAVQPGDSHYTADAHPPFWGTQVLYAYSEVKCTLLGLSMMTMAANTVMTCPLIFSFFTASGEQYGLNPAHSFNNFPENTDVQISCNAANSVGCTDWFIEPIGSLQAVGRLVPRADSSNRGDFYMRFHIRVTLHDDAGPLTCEPDATAMCLNAGRFRVTADWKKADGTTGQGQTVRLTPDSGYFWFFNAANIEAVVKVLNACAVNDRYWVFAAGLTNVEVTLRVVDTQTGSLQTYVNPLGTAYEAVQDTGAFATCP